VGAPSRAVSYNANVWEAPVQVVDGNYTYFVPLTSDMRGQRIDVVFFDKETVALGGQFILRNFKLIPLD
jgi:hypothetical protein